MEFNLNNFLLKLFTVCHAGFVQDAACRLQVHRYKMQHAACRFIDTRFSIQVHRYKMQHVGCRFIDTRCSMQVHRYKMQNAGS